MKLDLASDITINGVSKTYKTRDGEVQALTETNLTVPQGEFVVLLGPSGCGKTTLLRMIAGLLTPSTGQIVIGGSDMAKRGSNTNTNVSMVFQESNLLPWRSVVQNIELPLLHGAKRTAGGEAREIAKRLAADVGLNDFQDRLPSELSGGMRQRVAIARALSTDPSLLLMDEPFGALDAFTRDRLNLEVQRLWMESSFTTVLVTHSITEAAFLGDRVLVFSSRPGRVVETVNIDLPRPRSLEMQATKEFQELVLTLRGLLEGN